MTLSYDGQKSFTGSKYPQISALNLSEDTSKHTISQVLLGDYSNKKDNFTPF
jgi:hypothetical protein